MMGIGFIEPNVGSDAMIARISALLISVTLFLTPLEVMAQQKRSRSLLLLDQSQSTGPFFLQIFSGLRAAIDADARAHTRLFSESLDLSRFDGGAGDESLRRHLSEKYRDKDIGVIVAMGSGTGIPAEKLNEVFDPFFTTKRQGMGIGLSVSRTIVQAHKGCIWVENQKEGGAVFRLSLPLGLS